MGSEVTVGVIGVLGSLVGGSITALTSWISSRSQERTAALAAKSQEVAAQLAAEQQKERELRDRKGKITEIGRVACVAFMTKVDTIQEDGRALLAQIGEKTDHIKLAAMHSSYETEWRELVLIESPLHIMGPESLAKKARQLRLAVGEYCDLIDDACRTRRRSSKMEGARSAATKAREVFVSEAQSTFGVELGEPGADLTGSGDAEPPPEG
ncbi:hypothetical protein [Actinoplanes sp. HUAS TT8]|uniref:hypothetical protein n=1 Tax=Actinoplanes sp. HUAS TT8 TaxID=3447453 RepID=UPI003F51B659